MQEQAKRTIGLKGKSQNPPLPEDLTTLVKKSFKKERHGQTTVATLLEVGRSKVKLCVEGRQDSFTESLADFRKFYQLV